MKKIALFLGGANYYHTQKMMGWYIDFKKLLNYCKLYGEVVEAVYYTGVINSTGQRKFLEKLVRSGYSLKTKPVKIICDHNTGVCSRKGNMDIEIALDMMNMSDRYDVAILISGDSDFKYVIQQPVSKGKEVKSISTQCCAASELIRTTGIKFIDLCGIREMIEYDSASFAPKDSINNIPKVS